ncbi:MAG: glycosyltransferase family 9 protein [Microbacterium sp.]|uniref:glycosyltransferase family 9 protein n=1 Tax=Microbacterium sp. TaxID=51671 RepID=UPI001ACDBE1A|nr:glycosyltransferase family 9 protein [Microbacterium sp.]MBN9178755.1 glycosyltransferase family 9 protein [Microbacterium sp.]
MLRSDEIGDTVATLALLAPIRAQWPDAAIHLLVKPGPATVFHAITTIDRIIPWTPIGEGSALKRQVLTARQAVRRFGLRGYDLAVLPRWDFDDTPIRYLAAASRARSVVGFAPVPEREPVWLGDQSQLLTDVIPRGDAPLLSVQQLERIGQYLGLTWSDPADQPVGRELFDVEDERRATELAALPPAPGLVVGIGIGARNAKRQWPVSEIASALFQLSAAGPVSAQILGGEVDTERAKELAGLLRERGVYAADLAGALTLSESAAAISTCAVFLGNDSGLQHIASSLNIPTVVVTCHPATGSPWSDNAPERFGPWSQRAAVLQPAQPADGCADECLADEPHCITAVRASDVATAINNVLSSAAG